MKLETIPTAKILLTLICHLPSLPGHDTRLRFPVAQLEKVKAAAQWDLGMLS
jgi:hypothetical protein